MKSSGWSHNYSIRTTHRTQSKYFKLGVRYVQGSTLKTARLPDLPESNHRASQLKGYLPQWASHIDGTIAVFYLILSLNYITKLFFEFAESRRLKARVKHASRSVSCIH